MGPLTPKKKTNFKAMGDASEAAIIARLVEVGYEVLIPFGDNSRYDLVIEDGEDYKI